MPDVEGQTANFHFTTAKLDVSNHAIHIKEKYRGATLNL